MAIFKKKSVLLVAAILAACAMFFACSKDEEKEFTVKFMIDGNFHSEVKVKESERATLPSPTKADHIFDGWYTNPEMNAGKREPGTQSSTVTKDITFYGRWVSIDLIRYITFLVFTDTDANGNWINEDEDLRRTVEVELGRTVDLPRIGRDGMMVYEWFAADESSVGRPGGTWGPVIGDTSFTGMLALPPELNLLAAEWIYGETGDPAADTSAWFWVYFGQDQENDKLDEPAELELADVTVNDIKIGEVSWSMKNLPSVAFPNDNPCWRPSGNPDWGEWQGYYSHASMNVFFAGPTVGYYLTDDFEIEVTWTSNEALRLVLSDTHVYTGQAHCFSGEDRTSSTQGTGYRVTLPAGTHTQTFRKSDFRQPSTDTPDFMAASYVYTLDPKKVEAIAFSAIAPGQGVLPTPTPNVDGAKTTNVRLTQVIVRNLEWVGVTQ